VAKSTEKEHPGSKSTIVIEPAHGWVKLGLKELWVYRELLFYLTWRGVLVRYKQAVLGITWAVLQPFLTMVVFTVVFGQLLNVSSGDTPYAVFSYVGLLPWQLFAGATQRAGTSLIGNTSLLTKVYIPRLVIPLSAVLQGLVDFAIAFIILIGLMAYYQIAPTWNVLWLPAFTVLAIVTSLSVSLWLGALNVRYRDVQYIIPFIIQLWMYLSPVIYSATAVPSGPLRVIYSLNPMAGVIIAFRWALLGGPAPSKLLLVSTTVVLLLLVGGLYYFRRMERTFADVI
jgi:lipopolysaccharide transport system permease protein